MPGTVPTSPAAATRGSECGPTHVVRNRGRVALDLGRLWEYRELLFFLVWRDLKVRYRQTLLGAAWAVIQPLVTMVVFSVIFGRLAGIPSDGVPYPLFAFAALVPWGFVAQGVTQSANSLVGSHNLIRKVYFPRLVIPISAVLAGLADFAVAFLVLAGLMAWFGVAPSARALLTLPLLALATLTALAVGLWLSALNVRYRDVRYVVPFFLQIWLFATPVAYPSSLLGAHWHVLYAVNPMVGVVEGFRWALLDTAASPGLFIVISGVVTLAGLASGAYYFRRVEATFADLV